LLSSPSLADCLPDSLDVALFYHPEMLDRVCAILDLISSVFKDDLGLPKAEFLEVAESLPALTAFIALPFIAEAVPVLSAVCLFFSAIFSFTAFYFSRSFCFLCSVAEAAPVAVDNPETGYFKPLDGAFNKDEDGSFFDKSVETCNFFS
jgi:hypothetical protein